MRPRTKYALAFLGCDSLHWHLMPERGERVTRFATSVLDSYPSALLYLAHHDLPQLPASSSPAFRTARYTSMESLLRREGGNREMSEALALEYLVKLALQDRFENTGFWIELSPQTLERSEPEQKGIDLLIRDSESLVYLGIDVKLRFGKSPYQRDGYGWNPRLLSPYIYLSLGNCLLDTWEREQVPLLEWFRQHAVPKIHTSGKIPHWEQFSSYIVARIERSLAAYVERVREPEAYDHRFGLPGSEQELEILREKSAIVHSLFCELRQTE